jgi:hypothetical protein
VIQLFCLFQQLVYTIGEAASKRFIKVSKNKLKVSFVLNETKTWFQCSSFNCDKKEFIVLSLISLDWILGACCLHDSLV